MAAGLNATLTKGIIDASFGNELAKLRSALIQLKVYNDCWYAPHSTDYLTMPGGAVQADLDSLGSAVSEAILLYAVYFGTATIASGGAVTTGASGHNFDTFIGRLVGTGAIS